MLSNMSLPWSKVLGPAGRKKHLKHCSLIVSSQSGASSCCEATEIMRPLVFTILQESEVVIRWRGGDLLVSGMENTIQENLPSFWFAPKSRAEDSPSLPKWCRTLVNDIIKMAHHQLIVSELLIFHCHLRS